MVEPVPGGYASNIKDPVIEPAGTLKWWEAQYVGILDHLLKLVNEGKAQQAYKEIPMAMDMAQNYTTNGQNVEVSDKSNFDSTIGQYINAMQEDFDQYSTGDATKTGSRYAQDAQYAESKIQGLMTQYPEYASVLNDIKNQLDAIIPEDDKTDSSKLAKYWAGLWNVPDIDPDKKTPTGYKGTSPVSNAINAARNDVESQNTILNSQMQTYSKDASKDLAFEQDCYRAEIDMLKTPVNAAKNASS